MSNKINKSVNLTTNIIEKLKNYNDRTGTSFSEIVEASINLYFEALDKGNKIQVETLGEENMENSILVPTEMYSKINNIVPSEIYELEKQGKITIRTFTETNTNKSKTKFVVLTDNHPEYFKAKITMLELAIKNCDFMMEKINQKIK